MRIIALTAIVIAAALATPALASASTYCVGTSGLTCNVSKPAAGLQQALTEAAGTADSDVVRIGPGTYTGNFVYSSPGNEIDIQGSGNSTVIQGTGTDAALWVNGSGSASVVSDLEIRMADVADPEATVGLRLGAGVADSVRVTNPGASSGTAVQLQPSGHVSNSTVLAGPATGVQDDGLAGVHEVRDSFIVGALGVASGGSSSWTLENLEITAKYNGVSAGGNLTLRNSVVRVSGEPAFPSNTQALHKFGPGVLSANHVTVQVGPDVNFGVLVLASGAGSSKVEMNNSILSGPATTSSFGRVASGGGTANIVVGHSSFTPPEESWVGASNGPGVFQETPNGTNKSADPKFVDPSVTLTSPTVDLRLRHDSPLIDSGSPNGLSGTDLAGEPRVANGDDVGEPARDMGAYEYQRRPPVAAIAAQAAGPFPAGAPVAFSANGSNDPDAGDALTYAWSFGDGTAAGGPAASHAYGSAGQRVVTLTVTDPTGLTATATTAILVEAPPAGPAPDAPQDPAPGPDTGDDPAPVISAVSLSRARRVRFSLSENARVRFAVARRAGRRWVRAGSFARDAASGPNSMRLPSRLRVRGRTRALMPGRYRLTLVATDQAGNRSAARRLGFRIVRKS